ncbi:MAG: hypothetical protein EOP01_04110, partial [Propionibacteriaceae bacterium]
AANGGSAYRVQPGDAGKSIVAEVSGDGHGYHGSASTAPTGPVAASTSVLTVDGSSPKPTAVELVIDLWAPGLPPLDGKVTVRDFGSDIATLDVDDGHAYLYARGFSRGPHYFTVSFAGTDQVAPVETTTRVMVTDKVTPSLTLKAKSTAPKKVRVDILVDGGGEPLKGSVSVGESGEVLKRGIRLPSSGKARWKASTIAPGPHTFEVTYSGNTTVKELTRSVSVFVEPKLKAYRSCSAMHKDFPHGVGRVGAVDKSSRPAVTAFFAHDKLYGYNDGKKPRHHKEKDLDTDNDGIACEAS